MVKKKEKALPQQNLFLMTTIPFAQNVVDMLVPLAGLEPAHCFQPGILSPLCLPIPPQRPISHPNIIQYLGVEVKKKEKERFPAPQKNSV